MGIPNMSFHLYPISFSYKEKVIAAPVASVEFERRIRTEILELKPLIKEVTLGSNPSK
jgi:hypothetical protein